VAIEHINNILKRKAIVFLISDFMDSGFESALSITARKHDLIAIKILDEREEVLSDSGVIAFEDAETGEVCYVDTSSKTLRKRYWMHMQERKRELSKLFNRTGLDQISLRTGQTYENELTRFFKKRMKQFR